MSAAGTYAEALYEAAVEASAVTPVSEDLAALAAAVRESPELRAALGNPEIDTPARKAVIAEVAEGAHPLVMNFLLVLADRGRLGEIPEIADAFAARVSQAENRLDVEVVTAVPLPADLRERIIEQIRGTTGADVDLSESVDPDIVGGLVLRVGGSVIDGSVRHRIDELRQALRSAPVDAVEA